MSSAQLQPAYGKPRQVWLDWLRGISILLVLSTHYQFDWDQAGLFMPVAAFNMRVGWSGVDFFFAISGFLIGNLLLGEIMRFGTLDSTRFYLRRAARIWPLYYLTCLAYLGLAPFLLEQDRAESAMALLPSLAHLQNYFGLARGMAHFWSLAVEEHFYLLLPLLMTLLLRLPGIDRFRWRLLALCCATIALVLTVRTGYVLATGSSPKDVRGFTHFRIDALMVGVLLATLYRYWPLLWRRLRNSSRMLVLAAVAGSTVFAFNPNHSVFVGTIGYTGVQLLFGAAIIYASGFEGARVPMLRRQLGWLAAVGRHSYPIYLLHPFIWLVQGQLMEPLIADGDFVTRSLLWLAGYCSFLALSIAIGMSVGEGLERPLLALRNRICPPRSVALETAPVPAILRSGDHTASSHIHQAPVGASPVAAQLQESG